MALQTITTAADVLRKVPAGRGFPVDIICKEIGLIEPELGEECLGTTLYDWLLDNVAEIPADTKEWVQGAEYADGDFVVRNGCLFESLLGCNRNDPLDDPDSTWERFARFGDNDCANEFWEDYALPIVALKVYAASLNYATRQTGANGLTVLAGVSEFGGQGFKSANKAELAAYKTDLIEDTGRASRRMLRWVKKKIAEPGDCDVPLSGMLTCKAFCQPQSNSVRRWGFPK